MAARRFSFTQKSIDRIPLPGSGVTKVYDTSVPQLCAFIAPSGRVTFYYYGWSSAHGKPKRVKLGVYRTRAGADVGMGIPAARDKARRCLGDYANDKDPAAERSAGRAASRKGETVAEVWKAFIAAPSLHTKRPRSAKTVRDYENRYDKYLSAWGDRPLAGIEPQHVKALHARITKASHPTTANRVVAYFSAMCEFAKREKTISENPAADIDHNPEEQNTRYLTSDEAQRFMRSFKEAYKQASSSKRYGGRPDERRITVLDLIAFALYTGQRRSNVQALRWADVDLDRGTMTIAAGDFKTKREHVASLPPEAIEILNRRKDNGSEFVFNSTRSKTGHIVEPKTTLNAIIKAAGIDHLRFHDLRHTAATWMVNSGVDLFAVGRQLGHKNIQTTQRYAHLDIRTSAAGIAKGAAALAGSASQSVDEDQDK